MKRLREDEQLEPREDEQRRQVNILDIILWLFAIVFTIVSLPIILLGDILWPFTIVSTIVSLPIVLILMGEYAAYFGDPLAFIYFGMVARFTLLKRPWEDKEREQMDSILAILWFFTAVPLTIILILMGGYAAYFGDQLALIILWKVARFTSYFYEFIANAGRY